MAGYNGEKFAVAGVYPSGHPAAGVPAGPLGPNRATCACPAVTLGALINCALLAVVANELVEGMPNGKKIFINNSLIIKAQAH
jgi:hypothetical protein